MCGLEASSAERSCYTFAMRHPRTLPLFDERAQPASWAERMTPGEYAVHYSSFDKARGSGPSCTVLGSLAEAEAYAKEQVEQRPALRCRIYDHQGFIGQPIREFRGSSFKGGSEMSSRFRRWFGSGLFLGGLALIGLDWSRDFTLSWPAMIGIRLFFPGLFLILTEMVLILLRRRKRVQDIGQRMG
jgi:hypothetical protein